MFELKVNPKFPHHYIIGVAVQPMTSSTPGEMYLKYGPVYFTNDDVEKVSESLTLVNDKIYTKIYNMSNSAIYNMNDCSELLMSLVGLRLASQANQATIHHFSCECPVPDAEEFFVGYVERANICETEKRGLKNASVRG